MSQRDEEAWVSRAPGKVILFGEYAVLRGGIALVAAVERQASCVRSCAAHCTIEGLGFGQCSWDGEAWIGASLPFATAALDALGKPAAHFQINSEAFQLELGGQRLKLGLGSSAAVTVALIDAATRGSRSPDALFTLAQAAHFRAQGRLGSGADIAASAWGGLSLYQPAMQAGEAPRREGRPSLAPLLLVWMGQSADTRTLVSQVNAWAINEPREAARRFAALAEVAEEASMLLQAGSLSERDSPLAQGSEMLAATVDRGAQALRALGEASGAPLWIKAHARLSSLCARFGAAMKPTGAGGGDLAWVYPRDPASTDLLREAIEEEGFPAFTLSVAPARAEQR
ncbi:MAG: hypothetical protein VYD19_01750 [Myxococcota bacterium]|nr:hypothetical protein [Myxococcota bacterium]